MIKKVVTTSGTVYPVVQEGVIYEGEDNAIRNTKVYFCGIKLYEKNYIGDMKVSSKESKSGVGFG